MRIIASLLFALCLGGFPPAAHGLEMAWELLPGRARDIGVGADGSVWIIGSASGDGDVFRWNGSGWTAIGGSGVLIAVGPNGEPWVVNSNSDLFHRVNGQWVLVTTSGSVTGVGVGADGTVLATGGNFDTWGNYDRPLFRYTPGGGFTPLYGAGIVIEPDGAEWWLLDTGGNISRWAGASGYLRIEGHAKDISRGPNGTIWIVGNNGGFYRWNGTQFEAATTGQGSKISVAPDGTPWVVGSGKIYRGHPLFLSTQSASAIEGGTLNFQVTLSYPSDRPASVAYQVLQPDNSVAASGTLQFTPGQTNRTVSVATPDDSVFHDPRTYQLQLSNPSGTDLLQTTAQGTVTDNDAEAPVLSALWASDGGFEVLCPSRPGFRYQLQRRAAFAQEASWAAVLTLPGNGNSLRLTDPIHPAIQGFYRVVVSFESP